MGTSFNAILGGTFLLLAPFLGTALLICTLMLTGLALPIAAREGYLRATAQDGQNFTQEHIERVV